MKRCIFVILLICMMISRALFPTANSVLTEKTDMLFSISDSEQMLIEYDIFADFEEHLSNELQPVYASQTIIHMHHVYPQVYRSQFCIIFGEDIIDNYTVPLECSFHLSISYSYNQDWAAFLNVNPLPSSASTVAYAQMLAGKYEYLWPW